MCYHPSMGPTGRGVFPVMFWEGQASVWVALGDSQAHCMDLYQRTIPFLGTERGMLAKISQGFHSYTLNRQFSILLPTP